MTITITARRALAALAALLLACAALVALSGNGGSGRASAAGVPASLSCIGPNGAITKGTVNKVANTIAIAASSHGIVSPRDAASGQSTGKRQHKPYSFNKATDASSVAFLDASITGRVLPSCTFRYYQTRADGTSVVYYVVKLTNVMVSSYNFAHGSTETESLSLNFEKITWTYAGLPPLEDCLTCVA